MSIGLGQFQRHSSLFACPSHILKTPKNLSRDVSFALLTIKLILLCFYGFDIRQIFYGWKHSGRGLPIAIIQGVQKTYQLIRQSQSFSAKLLKLWLWLDILIADQCFLRIRRILVLRGPNRRSKFSKIAKIQGILFIFFEPI